MKIKILTLVRKYWTYKISSTGEVTTTNKQNGEVRTYASIEDFVRWVSYADTAISYRVAAKWNKKKQAIKDHIYHGKKGNKI